MSEQEDFYRREEDRKWRERVDERLVNLNAAQKTADGELDEIQEKLGQVDRIIRGDPEEKLEGLFEMLHHLQNEINKFNALFNPDIHGNGGLRNDINSLLDKRRRSETREGYIWKFVTALVVQFLILIGLCVVNWDRIQWFVMVKQHTYQAASVERETKRKKEQRAKKRQKPVSVPEVPRAEETDVQE